MIQIPTFQTLSADFQQTIDLELQLVTLRCIYNIRNDYFHLNFQDPDGVQLNGIKIVLNWPLLWQKKALINFSGDLMVIKDDASLTNEISYNTFGDGHNLYYLTPAELEYWLAENGVG